MYILMLHRMLRCQGEGASASLCRKWGNGEKGCSGVCGGGMTTIYLYTLYLKNEVFAPNSNTFLNLFIFATSWFASLIFQTKTIWSDRIHSLKYLRSTTSGLEKQWSCQDLNSIGKMIFTNFQSRFLHRICGFMQQRLGMKKVISYKVKKRRCFHHSFSDKG